MERSRAEWRSSMGAGLESEARRSLEFLDPTPTPFINGSASGFWQRAPRRMTHLPWLGWLPMAGNGARDAIVEVCQLAVSCCSCRGGHRRSRRMGLAARDEHGDE
ncbi:GM12993 [Drosophila sechellia]|uniref:GM12993 n=1 Tax=Drosophila sechellia TaxID=7238 RepID=B4IQA1_DROSE|nr:GM12993 [Drosophila sechellia]